MSKVSLRASQSPMTATEFMDWAPRGAYTTARTVKGTDRVFELNRHMERLVTSSKPFRKANVSDQDVCKIALCAIGDVMEMSTSLMEETDCKLTVVIAFGDCNGQKDGRDIEAFAHIEAMKKTDLSKPVYVALGGPPRHNAIVKDTKWIHDRKDIVDESAEDTLLLGNDETVILEGSQTNFFAVLPSGTIYTAGSGVLEGTVRAAVIDACNALKIPLLVDAPKVSEIELFTEAFLASTSRLVMSIDKIGSHELPRERPIATMVADWVKKHVDERSISVKTFRENTVSD